MEDRGAAGINAAEPVEDRADAAAAPGGRQGLADIKPASRSGQSSESDSRSLHMAGLQQPQAAGPRYSPAPESDWSGE